MARAPESSNASKLALISGQFLLYLVTFRLIGMSGAASALTVIPVITAALFFEITGGLIASLCAAALIVALLFVSHGQAATWDLALWGQTLPGLLTILLIGPLAGWLTGRDRRRVEALMHLAEENAHLYEQSQEQARGLKKRTERIDLLNTITRQLAALKTPHKLFEAVASAVHDAFGYQIVMVLFIDEKNDELVLEALAGTANLHVGLYRQKLGTGVIGWVGRTGETALVNDTQHDERFINVFGAPIHSEICVPIRYRERTIGVLDVSSDRLEAFDELDASTLQVVADTVSVILENVSLLEDLREANHALEGTIRRLEEANHSKDVFLATMSHELRTPLSTIVGYTEFIQTGVYGALTPQQNERLDRVLVNARQLLTLINDVLDLARITAGGVTLQPRAIAIDTVVAQAIKTIEPQLASKGLSLRYVITQPLPPVLGDDLRVQQIVVNLLTNAVKFTEAGEIEVAVRAWPGGPPVNEGHFVAISVRDTGIGIAPEDQVRIFEEFRQVDDSSTRAYGGAGLGLTIARRLVQLHNGQIWVESMPGEGAQFTFVLPALIASPAAASPAAAGTTTTTT